MQSEASARGGIASRSAKGDRKILHKFSVDNAIVRGAFLLQQRRRRLDLNGLIDVAQFERDVHSTDVVLVYKHSGNDCFLPTVRLPQVNVACLNGAGRSIAAGSGGGFSGHL